MLESWVVFTGCALEVGLGLDVPKSMNRCKLIVALRESEASTKP